METYSTVWFLTAIASAVTFGIAGFILKLGVVRVYSVPHILLGLYTTGALGFITYAAFMGFFYISSPLLFAGLVVGIGSTLGNVLFMKALRLGPISLTSPVVNMNIVLIVLMAVIVYGESPGFYEIIGICLVVLCVSILPVDPNEKISILDRKWYVLVFIAVILFFLRNGGLKITQEAGLNNTMVLFYGYLVGVIWTLMLVIRMRTAKIQKLKPGARMSGLYCGLIAGVFSFGGMQLYAIALAGGPASIVSPLFASNSLITGLLAILLLNERLSPIQIIAVAGIVTGIILVRM